MNDATAAAGRWHREGHWGRFAMRGVKSSVAGFGIAVCLWAVLPQPFGTTLVYSQCISLMCWLFIDTGRDVVAMWTANTRFAGTAAKGGWPGWAWMIVVVVVGAVLGYAAGNEIANRLTGLNTPGPFNANLRQTLSLLVLALVPAITITYFFQSREIMALQRAEVERAERQAAEQQLKLLQSQLEPHMLFNTLANLRALIALDPARAQAMLDRLIAFLRASLASSRASSHALSAEFDRLRDYLGLMEVRMGSRLATHFTLPEELASAQVPPLLLQPIVENSIKHGLEPKREGGRIDVSAAREGSTLILRVRDTGIGRSSVEPSPEGGFGTVHVRERLATLYGAGTSFELEPVDDPEGGMLAIVRLPLSMAQVESVPDKVDPCAPFAAKATRS
jgi:signal transduction histidine kinase